MFVWFETLPAIQNSCPFLTLSLLQNQMTPSSSLLRRKKKKKKRVFLQFSSSHEHSSVQYGGKNQSGLGEKKNKIKKDTNADTASQR